MSVADAKLIYSDACLSLQVIKTVNISLFSAVFMIPIGMIVPAMFQVHGRNIFIRRLEVWGVFCGV